MSAYQLALNELEETLGIVPEIHEACAHVVKKSVSTHLVDAQKVDVDEACEDLMFRFRRTLNDHRNITVFGVKMTASLWWSAIQYFIEERQSVDVEKPGRFGALTDCTKKFLRRVREIKEDTPHTQHETSSSCVLVRPLVPSFQRWATRAGCNVKATLPRSERGRRPLLPSDLKKTRGNKLKPDFLMVSLSLFICFWDESH